ncbi:IAP-1 [Dione juno nucleopolyhedrovirus]|uniref:IAP-1 n=1 Tax=Dione juno nucleopolyhedrovirus TaxID=2594175 RepID=A0AAE6H404_9ABAC|nr:IAP-1 [Dione juno nucleopolyhedrovirus]QDL56992.1 IAP-1 [Dione juno nucleopolyhedrovirus]
MSAPLYLVSVCDHDAERVFGMLIERHGSFENFPIDNDELINSLIVNGFKYAQVEDAVVCEYCGVVIKNWREDDVVEFVHATLSPYCVYANKIAQNEHFDEGVSTDAVVVSPGKPRCVYARLAHPSARRATFDDYWPGALRALTHDIAEAGMFHTALGDETACFFCDCRVRDWLPDDDPWRRHAFANPQCYFVARIKGDDFCDSARRTETSAESFAAAAPSSPLPSPSAEALECKVCLERQRDAVLLPCRHFCLCTQCYFALDGKCPTCRQDVVDFVKIFVA